MYYPSVDCLVVGWFVSPAVYEIKKRARSKIFMLLLEYLFLYNYIYNYIYCYLYPQTKFSIFDVSLRKEVESITTNKSNEALRILGLAPRVGKTGVALT